MNLKKFGNAAAAIANLEELKETYKMNKPPLQLNKALFAAVALFLVGCSNTRFVPEGDLLYTGATVNIISDSLSKSKSKQLENDLKQTLTPKPDRKSVV